MSTIFTEKKYIPKKLAGTFLAALIAMQMVLADQDPAALLNQAIARAVFQSERPEASDLSEADVNALSMVAELKGAKTAIQQNLNVFSFLEAQPVPPISENIELQKVAKILDARKAVAFTWLVKHGAKAQLSANPAAADSKHLDSLGRLLVAAAASSGSQATKAVLELIGEQKISKKYLRMALLGSVRNAWLFPESVRMLVDTGISCDPEASTGEDVLLVLLKNSAGAGEQALRNINDTLDLILAKTKIISGDVVEAAIGAAWPKVVERFLVVDPRHDAELCMEWLVAAKLANNKYPETAFQTLKTLFGDLKNKQVEAVRNLPRVRVYFFGNDEEHGIEPWVTDGTAEGTRMVADVNPGRNGSEAFMYGVASGGLVVGAQTEGGVRRLLCLRGDLTKPMELLTPEEYGAGGSPHAGCSSGGIVVIRAGRLLWQTNGTATGTAPIAAGKLRTSDFRIREGRILIEGTTIVGNRDTFRKVFELVPAKRQLLPLCESTFSLSRSFAGSRLFSTDASGGLLVGPKFPADGSIPQYLDKPAALLKGRVRADLSYSAAAQLDNFFYFAGDLQKEVAKGRFTSAYGVELFRTDGTPEGTSLVADLREELQDRQGSQPRSFFVLGKTLLFTADDGKHERRLWSFDGETTRMLHETAIPSDGNLVAFDGKAFFTFANQLWATDGTQEGTMIIIDLGEPPHQLISAGAALVLLTGSGSQTGLWRSDGTAAGTRRFITAVVNNNYLLSAPPAEDHPTQLEDPIAPPVKEDKLPEKKFKPVPIGSN